VEMTTSSLSATASRISTPSPTVRDSIPPMDRESTPPAPRTSRPVLGSSRDESIPVPYPNGGIIPGRTSRQDKSLLTPGNRRLSQYNKVNNQYTCISPKQQQQLFNDPLSGTTQVGQYQKKHLPTHTHPDHQPAFINFLHLRQSIASSV